MTIEEILDEMEKTLDDARPMPFASHRLIIDGDHMRELLTEAKLSIPAEIKRAKMIDAECNRIIDEARTSAEKIVQDAESKAKRMIAREAVLQEAKRQAVDLMTKAQEKSNGVKSAAVGYVDRVLTDAQEHLQSVLQQVQATKESIAKVKKS